MTNSRNLALVTMVVSSGLLCGCISAMQPTAFGPQAPLMRPETFFAGDTRSFGVLEAPGGAPSRVFHVEGHGRADPDGTFRLDQTVSFDGKSPEQRTWLLRSTDANGYRGTLTDASGEVVGEAYGDLFHLHYRLRSVPLGRMEQWMYLQADGRTVLNEATVTVAGVVVARLSERITRSPSPEGQP